MLKSQGIRQLTDRDAPALSELLNADPIANCFPAARVESYGVRPREFYGYQAGSTLMAACFFGSNVVPIGAHEPALRAFAARARRQGRRCSSIVGSAEAVSPLWDMLRSHWGSAREVRRCQPLMAIDTVPKIPGDDMVRRVAVSELDILMPACVAMFTEEVGVSPLGFDHGASYRARVRDLIESGRVFARVEDDTVVFKAEIGAISKNACQIQGVWVHPDRRGQGLSVAGTARVVQIALYEAAPVVSLYVNDYNTPARAAYRRVGFDEVGVFMSVLF